jgi:hypothetical protein
MKGNWLSKEIARKYNGKQLHRILTKGLDIDTFLDILSTEYQNGKNILNLSFAPEVLAQLIWQRIPSASITNINLLSISRNAVAVQNFKSYKKQQSFLQPLSLQFSNSKIPNKTYQIIVSLQNNYKSCYLDKKQTFNSVNKLLEKNGLFLILAQIAETFSYYPSCHTNAHKQAGASYSVIVNQGETFEAYAKKIQTNSECSTPLEPYLSGICEAGFKLVCLHLCGSYALFAARKI